MSQIKTYISIQDDVLFHSEVVNERAVLVAVAHHVGHGHEVSPWRQGLTQHGDRAFVWLRQTCAEVNVDKILLKYFLLSFDIGTRNDRKIDTTCQQILNTNAHLLLDSFRKQHGEFAAVDVQCYIS